jgi:hypothetical protein
MDGDDELPNIDLNPSGSDTIPSGGGEGFSSNGGGEPLPGGYGQVSSDHDQPPEGGDFPNAASANSEPMSIDSNNSQGEEARVSDNEDDNDDDNDEDEDDDDDDDDDESALPSSYQGKDAPSIKPDTSAR